MLAMGKTACGKWMPRRGLLRSRKGTGGVMIRSLKCRLMTSQKYALRKPSHSCASCPHVSLPFSRKHSSTRLTALSGNLRRCPLSFSSMINEYLAAGHIFLFSQEESYMPCCSCRHSIALQSITMCHKPDICMKTLHASGVVTDGVCNAHLSCR